MADGVFNISKGAVAEKIRDGASAILILLLQAAEAETALVDHEDVAALLAAAGNTEATFTNYARKTAITGSITVDHANDRVDIDMPDQTWAFAGNGVNNTMVKAVVAYEEAAADATRIPLTHHDFTPQTDGTDLTLQVNASGFFRASGA